MPCTATRGVGVRSDGTRRGNGLGSTLAMWAPAGIAAGFISPATSSGSAQISSRVESNGGRIKPKLLAILIWPSSLPPPGTANSATCAPARLGRGGFSEAAMPHYRSAQQRRFPEPFVREIEERFGDCLDTDHSAGRGNGMSGIVAGKQPNEAERIHRGERAPRRGLDCRPNVRAEPHR